MKKILFVFSVIVVVVACKKSEDNNTPTNLAVTKANIAGTYKVTAATFTPNGTTVEVDVFSDTGVYKTCKKDDLLKFDTASYYTYTDAGIVCSPNGSAAPSLYSLSGNTLTYEAKDYTVATLTSAQLIITRTDSIPFNGSYIKGNGKLTLSRQ